MNLYEFVSIYTVTKKIVIENRTFLIDLQIKYFFFRFIIFLTRHRGLNKHLYINNPTVILIVQPCLKCYFYLLCN